MPFRVFFWATLYTQCLLEKKNAFNPRVNAGKVVFSPSGATNFNLPPVFFCLYFLFFMIISSLLTLIFIGVVAPPLFPNLVTMQREIMQQLYYRLAFQKSDQELRYLNSLNGTIRLSFLMSILCQDVFN